MNNLNNSKRERGRQKSPTKPVPSTSSTSTIRQQTNEILKHSTSNNHFCDKEDYVLRLPNPAIIKADMKRRNEEFDRLVNKLEDFNNKINEMAAARNVPLNDDPIKNMIAMYHEKFDRRK